MVARAVTVASVIGSESELGAAVVKAAVGCGFAAGVADELGGAARWLHRRDVDPLPAVVSMLEALPIAPPPATHCLYAGLVAIDQLLTDPHTAVTVKACTSPLLVLGVAGTVCDAWQLAWQVECAAAGTVKLRTGHLSVIAGSLPTDPCGLRLSSDRHPDRVTPDARALHARQFDEQLWARLQRLGARTLVPSSAVSALHGAGAGLLDND